MQGEWEPTEENSCSENVIFLNLLTNIRIAALMQRQAYNQPALLSRLCLKMLPLFSRTDNDIVFTRLAPPAAAAHPNLPRKQTFPDLPPVLSPWRRDDPHIMIGAALTLHTSGLSLRTNPNPNPEQQTTNSGRLGPHLADFYTFITTADVKKVE